MLTENPEGENSREMIIEEVKHYLLAEWETSELRQIREAVTPENLAESRDRYQALAQSLGDSIDIIAGTMFANVLMLMEVGKQDEAKSELWNEACWDLHYYLSQLGFKRDAARIEKLL